MLVRHRGKTTHIAELMGDRGRILACDQTASRLRQLEANIKRLDLKAIEIHLGDSRDRPQWPWHRRSCTNRCSLFRIGNPAQAS
jgi:16S rRNA C967 or C1407 C5-methylase (RsmB/RsmF family)